MTGASWSDGSDADDSWGPATPVRSASADATPNRVGRVPPRTPKPARGARAPRSAYSAPASPGWDEPPARSRASARAKLENLAAPRAAQRQRGFNALVSVLFLVAFTVVGILIDALRGVQLGNGFNLGVIIGSVVAVLVVRRSSMFPVVVAPPIVYSLGAGISLYLRSSGLSDRSALIDAATNWLVYGFPAIAAASAAVLIIAGLRLITRR